MSDSSFPTVRWRELTVTFHAEPIPPHAAVWAVVVFAIHSEGFVIADIPSRGWCTPSGRIEPCESAMEAALRETREEVGAELLNPEYMGYYTLTDPEGATRLAVAFVGQVERYGDLPPDSESLGTRSLSRDELPNFYWHWDYLLDRMFEYAEGFSEDSQSTRQDAGWDNLRS